MAFKGQLLLSLYTLLVARVIADVNFGDCSPTRQEQIKAGLVEAKDIATVAVQRLEKLLQYTIPHNIPVITNQPDKELRATFNTYASYVDNRLRTIHDTEYNQRSSVQVGIQQFLGLSASLRDNIGHVLSRPVNTNSNDQSAAPNINFQCSDNWLAPVVAKSLTTDSRTPPPLFYDARSNQTGGPLKELDRIPVGFADGLKPFDPKKKERVPMFLVNGMGLPFSSALSIYSKQFAKWATLQSQATTQQPFSIRVQQGAVSYPEIRQDIVIPNGQCFIQDLIKDHASSDLLTMLGESPAMSTFETVQRGGIHRRVQEFGANSYFSWPPFMSGNYTLVADDENCLYEGEKEDPSSWQCIKATASSDAPERPFYRPYTFKYLMIALYLDKYDWSKGFNTELNRLGPAVPPRGGGGGGGAPPVLRRPTVFSPASSSSPPGAQNWPPPPRTPIPRYARDRYRYPSGGGNWRDRGGRYLRNIKDHGESKLENFAKQAPDQIEKGLGKGLDFGVQQATAHVASTIAGGPLLATAGSYLWNRYGHKVIPIVKDVAKEAFKAGKEKFQDLKGHKAKRFA